MDHMQTTRYAHNLLKAMGPKAELFAAQKAQDYQTSDNQKQASVWQRIRLAIAQRKANVH